ncbi:hypothetical protein ZWY2020_010524 [Hordeum vulgare]|nr:hypothetical protein ZWY2020_010524 [Hordeum vulgare]
MADLCLLPRVFALHVPIFNTPWVSIVVTSLIALGMSFFSFNNIVATANFLYNLGMLLEFATLSDFRISDERCRALFECRRDSRSSSSFVLVPSGFLVFVMAIAGWKVYANSAIFTATGLEVYYLMKFCKANGFLKFGTIDGKGSMYERHQDSANVGVSLKTQELYALVFAARYLDLFVHFVSLYNTVMKLVFLASSFSIVWYMRKHKIVRRTYDREHDTFRHHFIVLPCLVLALLINERFTFREVMWAFSIYLEAVAILPQLVLLQRTRNIDNLTGQYVFFLGAYRVLYILNWIYRYFTEPHFVHWISWIAGIVQTMLYADFFYYYIISWKNNVKLELPA